MNRYIVSFGLIDLLIVCPNDLSNNQRRPQLHNSFVLERRKSDTMEDEFGVTLLIEGAFAGWVVKAQLDAVKAQMEVGGCATGRMIELHRMPWSKGGSYYLRDRIEADLSGFRPLRCLLDV